jgi:hypothetical protein
MTALDHRYRGEHPVRTLAYLFSEDRRRIAVSVIAFMVKHSPTWTLPLITANVIDVLVAHRPVVELWANTGALLFLLVLNYPGHLLYVRNMHGTMPPTCCVDAASAPPRTRTRQPSPSPSRSGRPTPDQLKQGAHIVWCTFFVLRRFVASSHRWPRRLVSAGSLRRQSARSPR